MGRKPTQTSLVIVVSLFLLLFPAYLRYTNLSEVNLFPTDVSFENADQNDQFDGQHHDADGYGLSSSSIVFLPGIHLPEQASYWFVQLSTGQQTPILRC